MSSEFKSMVTKLRKLESALGDGIKRCMPSEENVKQVARKSIFANSDITEGAIFHPEDLIMKRPGTGISPVFVERIIGSRARASIRKDQMLEWKHLDLNSN